MPAYLSAKFCLSFLQKYLCVHVGLILFDGINKLQAEFEKLVWNRNWFPRFSASPCKETSSAKVIGMKIC